MTNKNQPRDPSMANVHRPTIDTLLLQGDYEKTHMEYGIALFERLEKGSLWRVRFQLLFPKNRVAMRYWARQSAKVAMHARLDGRVRIAGLLERLLKCVRRADRKDVTIAYARSLDAMILQQDPPQDAETFQRMKPLFARLPDDKEILEIYARSLRNVSLPKGKKEAEVELAKLHGLHPDNVDVAKQYAAILHDLSSESKEVDEILELVDKVRELSKEYPDNVVVQQHYCGVLCNLVIERSNPEKNRKVLKEIETVYSHFEDQEAVARIYTLGLFNMILQDRDSMREYYENLQRIGEKFPDSRRIAENYSGGLNVLLHHNPEDEALLKRTIALYEKHPVPYIADRISEGYVLRGMVRPDLLTEITDWQAELRRAHKDSIDCSVYYTIGLLARLTRPTTPPAVLELLHTQLQIAGDEFPCKYAKEQVAQVRIHLERFANYAMDVLIRATDQQPESAPLKRFRDGVIDCLREDVEPNHVLHRWIEGQPK